MYGKHAISCFKYRGYLYGMVWYEIAAAIIFKITDN
jgi:hypothetical protein